MLSVLLSLLLLWSLPRPVLGRGAPSASLRAGLGEDLGAPPYTVQG